MRFLAPVPQDCALLLGIIQRHFSFFSFLHPEHRPLHPQMMWPFGALLTERRTACELQFAVDGWGAVLNLIKSNLTGRSDQ